MRKELEELDEILAHFEDFMHGENGNMVSRARAITRKAISEIPLNSKCSFCGKELEPKYYCNKCDNDE